MGNYILKRTLLIIPTMFLVSIIVFLFQRFIPGSAVDVIEAQFIAMGQTDIDRAAIIHQLGLDVPILQQYINWIGGIITRGDFGTSINLPKYMTATRSLKERTTDRSWPIKR